LAALHESLQAGNFGVVIGGKLRDAVTLTVSGCPNGSTCTLTPTQVGAGKSTTTVALQIQTSVAVAGIRTQPGFARVLPLYAFWLSFPGLMFTFSISVGWPRRSRVGFFFSLAALFILLCCTLSCGGGLQGSSIADPQPGTTPSTYLVTATATMNSAPGSPTQTVVVVLTVN